MYFTYMASIERDKKPELDQAEEIKAEIALRAKEVHHRYNTPFFLSTYRDEQGNSHVHYFHPKEMAIHHASIPSGGSQGKSVNISDSPQSWIKWENAILQKLEENSKLRD